MNFCAIITGVRHRLRHVVQQVTTPTPSSILISPAPFAVAEGATVQLSATVYDQLGNVMAGQTVTWSSSAAGVATVNSSGLVTGVAAGACSITASVTGASVSTGADCTVSPAAVASVAVSPTTASLTEGATTTVAFQPKDSNGNSLAGRTVTVSTADAGTATISVSGYTGTITAVAAGSTTVKGTCETIDSGNVSVTVTAPASGSHPNEPASMTQVHDTNFVGFTTTNPAVNSGSLLGLVRYLSGNQGREYTDTVAPYNGSSVLRVTFPNGSSQGTGPEHLWPGSGTSTIFASHNFTTIYISSYIRVDSDWRTPTGSGVQKLFHIWGLCDAVTSGQGGSLVVPSIIGSVDSTTAPIKLQLRYQNLSTVNGAAASFNGASVTINRGQWYQLEVALTMNSGSAADGTATMYVDGVQRTTLTNLTYRNGGTKEWTTVQLNPTYGGSGSVTGPQYLYYADWYTSGKP